ncbi:putative SNARE-dependent exocytosis protein [Taphrina deformans PYCC 5710]|uniref:SNARE-dependent exocytosis protein n=1 Tax=Taphrina deformans (strain PYCC 5710 / ATCC 11124 / CBS 356.35 / IMI 108563 / JCM 9778 / NBRC 8474) TaxID=1097556 RepID=R4XC59_TAPDE|nr:putative SNARE-dependent exocytosis protein [Taphrina deformans PYCC 5710]|eukprot:CCG81966.1 putative SNARE-dependent exocytosis protein [Taphrina deformans PYCC 5710]
MDSQLQQAFMDLSLVEPMPTPITEAKDMLFKFSGTRSAVATFEPLCVISARRGQVTALCVSAIGFVAIAYDSGFFILIDLRGPAIFHAARCDNFEVKKKDRMFKKPATPKVSSSIVEFVTAVSFLAMNVESRISLVAVLGTNQGRVISFELLKDSNGMYTAIMHNVLSISTLSSVQAVYACNQFGEALTATGLRLASINTDAEVPECLLVVADEEVVSYSDLSTKIASSLFRAPMANGNAQIVTIPNTGIVVLAIIQHSNTIELFSIPELKSLGTSSLRRNPAGQATILDDGHVIVHDDAHSLSLFDLFGKSQKLETRPQSELYDALKQAAIPRPTISNWAWVTGTQYVKPTDLDHIITGGTRPLSKRALERLAASEKQQALLERQAASRDKASNRAVLQNARLAGGNDRGNGRNAYGEMQQHGQERGERISQVNDVFDNISKASGEWLSEIDKMTSNAKKSAGKAALKSFLGF